MTARHRQERRIPWTGISQTLGYVCLGVLIGVWIHVVLTLLGFRG